MPGGSKLAEAIRYALNRWNTLIRFLDDGRIDLDTDSIECAIRPVALGHNNSLFAGSDGGADRWAVLASLIETAKFNDVENYVWLRDVLTRMVEGQPMQRFDELLLWKHDRSNVQTQSVKIGFSHAYQQPTASASDQPDVA